VRSRRLLSDTAGGALVVAIALAGQASLGSLAAAETSASSEERSIETIAVVTSPLPGIAIDRDKIPTDVQTFTATDLAPSPS
jgi:hypothetical protein